MLNYRYVVFSVLIYLGFNFWMKCIGEFLGIKKPAGAGLLKGCYHGIFNILASTTTPTILQFPLISIIGYCGFKGFRKRLPASITNFLKVASLSPSNLATTNFPLIGSTSGSTRIAAPSGMLRPTGDVIESPWTSNQKESSEHSTVVSYQRSIALRDKAPLLPSTVRH
ncbi:Uncharacterised protein [Klebsiella pneumoniae]|nr:Uncharacterised protein [Klebsiella pneumoniae]